MQKPLWEEKLQPSRAIPALQREKEPWATVGFRNGLSCFSSEGQSGKAEVFKAMGSSASEDEALGGSLSSTPGGDSTGTRFPPFQEPTQAES